MKPYQFQLFPPTIERRAEIPAGSFFSFGGRPMLVCKTYGTDAAAPVIVEELSNAVTLKGQLGMWSVDGVSRAMRGKS